MVGMNIYEKLIKIQNALNVPKTQFNKYGKYTYRSAEDILSAAKPLLDEYQVCLFIEDDLVMVNGQNYIKSVVRAINAEDPEQVISTVGYAKEAKELGGMSDSQITGATMSYASKYALGHLFLLDDTKDADATNQHGKTKEPSYHEPAQSKVGPDGTATFKDYAQETIPVGYIKGLINEGRKKGKSKKSIEETAKKMFGKQLEELTTSEYGQLYRKLESLPDKSATA